MSFLAETAAAVDDRAAGAVLYEVLLPWGHLNAGDHPEGVRGSLARCLGLLAPSFEDAERHFEAALEHNERMRARPWLAHTQSAFAAALDGRDDARAAALRAEALATCDELGMEPVRLVSPSGR